MIFEILFSLFFAVFFAILLANVFGRRGPGPAKGLIFFITLMFLFSWAVGGWITPMGPVHWGVSWMGYLLVALLIALLLGALLPSSKTSDKPENEGKFTDDEMFQQEANKYPMELGFGIFFWLTVIVLLGMAIVKIFW
jgi:ABC-type transport system involved in cytochrome c biogenesis permease component